MNKTTLALIAGFVMITCGAKVQAGSCASNPVFLTFYGKPVADQDINQAKLTREEREKLDALGKHQAYGALSLGCTLD